MTTSDSPVVSPIGPEEAPELAARLNQWRDGMPAVDVNGETQAFAVTVDGTTIGGYLMANIGLANEIVMLAIDPAHRRRGHGRMCCMDALFRSGKRPLVLNADEAAVGFARAVGFKIIGKRKQADGGSMYRLGWHAPRPGTDPSSRSGC